MRAMVRMCTIVCADSVRTIESIPIVVVVQSSLTCWSVSSYCPRRLAAQGHFRCGVCVSAGRLGIPVRLPALTAAKCSAFAIMVAVVHDIPVVGPFSTRHVKTPDDDDGVTTRLAASVEL